MRGNMRYLL